MCQTGRSHDGVRSVLQQLQAQADELERAASQLRGVLQQLVSILAEGEDRVIAVTPINPHTRMCLKE